MATQYFCKDPQRREDIKGSSTLNGIDYVEVATADDLNDQRFLRVHFIPKEAGTPLTNLGYLLDALDNSEGLVRILGGTRTTDIGVQTVERVTNHLKIEADKAGDFSTYTLEIDHSALNETLAIEYPPDPPQIDPVFAECDFSFKAECPSGFDWREEPACPPEAPPPAPAINYLASTT